MGRGVSSGGGQSSLGYLFGGPPPPEGKMPAPPPQEQQHGGRQAPPPAACKQQAAPPAQDPRELPAAGKPGESAAATDMAGASRLGRNSNNYYRADGQNTGNFITDRPSTKVHSAPGGGSSLGYLFGGGEN